MKENDNLQKHIILLGPPGCGKTTLANKLHEKYKYHLISTGDLLKQQLTESTALAKTIKQHMEEKTLLPDYIIIEMIVDAIQNSKNNNKWILDGFPRTEKQAQALLEEKIVPDMIFELQAPQEICRKRILERRIDPLTNRIYNLSLLPTDPEIKSRLKQRTDDNYDNFKSRYQAYELFGKDVLTFYNGIIKLQATSQEEEIFENFCNYLILPSSEIKIESSSKVNSIPNQVATIYGKEEVKTKTDEKKERKENSKEIKAEIVNPVQTVEQEESKEIKEIEVENLRLTNRDTELTKTNESEQQQPSVDEDEDDDEKEEKNEKMWTSTSRLLQGIDIIKHGRRGAPHVRTVFCDEKLERIYWQKKGNKLKCKTDQSIKLKDVEIARGIATEILQRSGEIAKRNVYISIIGDDRSLDMECVNEKEADELYNYLHEIVQFKKTQK